MNIIERRDNTDVATGRGHTPNEALDALAATVPLHHGWHTTGHRRIYELASGIWEAQITIQPTA